MSHTYYVSIMMVYVPLTVYSLYIHAYLKIDDKEQIFLLLCSLFTNAVNFSDEDINFPLFSYLLTKLQQLESKMLSKATPIQCLK